MQLRRIHFLVAALALGATPAVAGPKPPNIVFILADDLGFGDLKCYGHPYARTPNLDKLAAEGTRFAQFHVTGMTCCPSRTGFMTGKFPASFRDYPAGAGFGGRTTVTGRLKEQGYRTGHFGKWHIGPTQAPGTYGIEKINAADGDRRVRSRQDPRGRDAHIFDDAIAFIKNHRDGPFYVNVWCHSTHSPVDPPRGYADAFKDVAVNEADFPEPMRRKLERVRKAGGDVDAGMRRYLGDVLSLDDSVGRLLKAIDDLGLRDDTIVVFSSDHGASDPTATKVEPADGGDRRWNMLGFNGDSRGGKHTTYEGGVRVPFIIRWPGHVPANRVDTSSVIGAIDWLPTLGKIAGAKIDAKNFDGEDVSGVWLGEPRERTRPLFWKKNSARSEIAIRDGRWKLFHPRRKRGEPELYDLSIDPREGSNLAAKHPEVVERLTAMIEKWDATLPKEYGKANDED